jgi:Reverse transcriptase (RNA-dependent DNA polymerase)
MRAYYRSSPDRRGYRQRMLALWRTEHPGITMNEQRLSDQRRVIERNRLLSAEEIEQVRRRLDNSEVPLTAAHGIPSEISNPMANDQNTTTSAAEQDTATDMNTIPQGERERLPPLKGVNKKMLAVKIAEANERIKTMRINSLDSLNDIAYGTARTITIEMGFKVGKKPKKEMFWKIRIERKIARLRRDLSQTEAWKRQKLKNDDIKKRLEATYHINAKGLATVAEELKQRLTTEAMKLQRYNNRILQYRQNWDFNNNQKRLYTDLQGEDQRGEAPDPVESVMFWSKLWDTPVTHNKEAKWMEAVRKDNARVKEQASVTITKEKVEQAVRRMKNWKAPGPDEVHGFWLKKLTSLHEPMAKLLEESLEKGCPSWMTQGRTVLLQKDKAKGSAVDNYRPITCLPTMWKLLSGILNDEIRSHLEENGIIPREQKGCRPNCRGTKDHLLTDKAIVKNCKRRKTNLHMVWIDYKKAYDSVPHSWLMECLEMYRISRRVRTFLAGEMAKWTTELTSAGRMLGQVPIRRGIFQGDSLSPLLFIMAMIPISNTLNRMKKGYEMEKGNKMISHLLYMDDLKMYTKTEGAMKSMTNTLKMVSKDIGMEFGMEKCAKLEMKRGKLKAGGDLLLSDGERIKELDDGKGYKYLGVLQADSVKKEEAKEMALKEYYRRTRAILKSQLNAGNTIKAINSWAIPVIRYTAGVIRWTIAELQETDRKTRKLLTMHRAFNMNGDVDRLYIGRPDGGKGLLQVEQVVREEECALGEYVRATKAQDMLVAAVVEEHVLDAEESRASYRQRVVEERKHNWRNKKMHGQFLRQTEDLVDQQESARWLVDGWMKKESESLLMAAQEQSLRTRKIMHDIDHRNVNPKCRLCGEKDETVEHLVSACSKLAQTEYKARHDKVAALLHWRLCKKFDIPVEKDWYRHKTQSVVENPYVKILWDFSMQTDKVIQARRPDIVVLDKVKGSVQIIDIAVPADRNVIQKEEEKVMKYQDLRMELARLWKKKVRVIPVVVGALGSIPSGLKKSLCEMEVEDVECRMLQRAALLGTARILRRTLAL